MKTTLLLISALIINLSVFAQKDLEKTSYKNLEVKRFYSIMTESTTINGKAVYKANGKEVTKEKYDKYTKSRTAIEECKPCILETYDENEKLQVKAVQYKDCCVGFWIGYYPNGKVKTAGQYRENESGIWDPLWDHGYCIKHGIWTEFNDKGKPVKTEEYNFGSVKTSK